MKKIEYIIKNHTEKNKLMQLSFLGLSAGDYHVAEEC
jgi:flavorubredoxin